LINFKNIKNNVARDEDNLSQTAEGNLKNDLLPQKKKKAIKLVCKFKAPPNRYGIEPGYMWDGVDRSNKFEQKLLATRNIRAAEKSEHYKLRTEEM